MDSSPDAAKTHIPASKMRTLESVPWVSVLGRLDCMLSRKEIHCRSDISENRLSQ